MTLENCHHYFGSVFARICPCAYTYPLGHSHLNHTHTPLGSSTGFREKPCWRPAMYFIREVKGSTNQQ